MSKELIAATRNMLNGANAAIEDRIVQLRSAGYGWRYTFGYADGAYGLLFIPEQAGTTFAQAEYAEYARGFVAAQPGNIYAAGRLADYAAEREAAGMLEDDGAQDSAAAADYPACCDGTF